MRLKVLNRGFYLALVFAALGCGKQEKSSEFIPYVTALCTSTQAADCSGDALELFVGLVDSMAGADCDDFLTGMNATQRRLSFIASGTATTSRAGIYLTGTVTEWKGSTGATVDVLNPGSYQVCAFIDTDANGLLDTNEPVGTGALTPGGDFFELDDWLPAYN